MPVEFAATVSYGVASEVFNTECTFACIVRGGSPMRHSIAPVLVVLSSLTVSLASAQQPAAPAPAPAPAPEPPPVRSKWNATLYGYLDADVIYDTTQSYAEAQGGAIIARPGTLQGDHDRLTFSYRNSRIGFRLSAPEALGLRASGLVEFDFNGNQPPGLNETAFWTNATMRGRQAWLKVETDYLDILFGQTWAVFAFQPFFHPNSVQFQGVPGQNFSRVVQLRLSRTFKTEPLNVDVAVAAARSPQRDSGVPDGQAGIKFALNGWKGQHVGGGGAIPTVDGLSLAASGIVRQFEVIQFAENPVDTNKETGWGVSLDGFIPVIPASSLPGIGALSLHGSFQTGSGFNDEYTGLTGGVGFPTFPATAPATPATPNIDPGLVTYDAQGQLHTIDWNIFLAGFQYFLPPAGAVWISGAFSQLKSGNIDSYGAAPGSVFTKMQWYDVNLVWNVTPVVRFGLEFASGKQTFADATTRDNRRVQFSGFYQF
ncbi:MAG: porin [Deltaproteobacteria bacterium]